MLPIQDNNQNWWVDSGSNWWVNGMARFAGGQIGRNVQSDTTFAAVQDNRYPEQVVTSVSDHQQEGTAVRPLTPVQHEKITWHDTYNNLRAGHSQRDATEVTISAIASEVEIDLAALRKHQDTGLGNFGDEDNNLFAANGTFNSSINGDMLRDPALTFAVTTAGRNRADVLSLLM